jgi:hypothetical protein
LRSIALLISCGMEQWWPGWLCWFDIENNYPTF